MRRAVDLVWQVLVESMLLAGLGGLLGVAISNGLLQGFRLLAPVSVPRLDEVGLNGTVLAVALGLNRILDPCVRSPNDSPAIRLSRTAAGAELTGAARRGGLGHRDEDPWSARRIRDRTLPGAPIRCRRLHAELDGRCTASTSASMNARSCGISLSLPTNRFVSLDEIVAFYATLESSLAAVPGVESVGSIQGAPLAGGNVGGPVFVEGRPDPEPGEQRFASVRPVTAGYMEALGISILRGRGIQPSDGLDDIPIAVVNETFAREQVFPPRTRSASAFVSRLRTAMGHRRGPSSASSPTCDARSQVIQSPSCTSRTRSSARDSCRFTSEVPSRPRPSCPTSASG